MTKYRDYSKELDPDYREEKLWASNLFLKRNFKATLIEDNENFFIFQWKAPENIEYSARYILDKKKGYLMIYGDTGESMSTWASELNPKDVESYISDIEYFISKMVVSTETYTYYFDNIEKDFKRWKEAIEEEEDSEFIDDYDEGEILTALYDCQGDIDKMFRYDDLIERYSNPLIQDIENIGKRISKRVYLWSVGYQMAVAQLGII